MLTSIIQCSNRKELQCQLIVYYQRKRLLTIWELAFQTIYRMEEKNILSPIKTPGGQRRFPVDELDKYKKASKDLNAPQNPHSGESVKLDNNASKSDNEKTPKYDKRNLLNNLTGSEWLPETKSFSYQKGLGSKHPHAKIERMHPAPFSFQDILKLITFFTKEENDVLDPFGGVGSTAKACALSNRRCTSIELTEKWHNLSIERLETEVGENSSTNHTFINGDSKFELDKLEENSFDFIVTSPPYWSILNKKADHKVIKERLSNNLATNYSENNPNDLGNIEDYNTFLDVLINDFFLKCGRVLKEKKYFAIVVSDFRNKSKYISFHSDLIHRLQECNIDSRYKFTLQGCKVLLQNHKSLLPYGYPFAYVENIHHQYIVIFRKEKSIGK